jgi:hypothetical protein
MMKTPLTALVAGTLVCGILTKAEVQIIGKHFSTITAENATKRMHFY